MTSSSPNSTPRRATPTRSGSWASPCPPPTLRRTSPLPFRSSAERGGTRASSLDPLLRRESSACASVSYSWPDRKRVPSSDGGMRLHPSAYVLALATVAVHLAFAHRFGYYRDELYFIDCAKHLAWGYVDQPPLAPIVTWLTGPLGYPVWGLRFFPSLFAGVTVLLGCAIARELGGRAFAQFLTGLTIVARSRIDRHRVRSLDRVSFAGFVDRAHLPHDSSGQNTGSPAVYSDRAGRDGCPVREIFDRRVRARSSNRSARNGTRQASSHRPGSLGAAY